jgi:hypothetical protein
MLFETGKNNTTEQDGHTSVMTVWRGVIWLIILLPIFLGTTCKEEPVEPDNGDSGRLPPLDTTSHDFVWQSQTFGGEFAFSVFYDVAIINDTCIWAVGELNLKDSLGNIDYICYNAAQWDGKNWTIKRISPWYRDSYITAPLYCVFAFSEKDIWCSLGVPIHGDGKSWTFYQLWDMGVVGPNDGGATRIWGTSSNNIYFGDQKGTIVHYDGTNFQKLPTLTTLEVKGIWGGKNPLTGKTEILAVASGPDTSVMMLRLDDATVAPVSKKGLDWYLGDVWFDAGRKYYVVGYDIYSTSFVDTATPWRTEPNPTRCYMASIRGNNANDLFTVGAYGATLHYNGATWKDYPELWMSGMFNAVAIKGNLVVIVGEIGNSAIIVMGRRK